MQAKFAALLTIGLTAAMTFTSAFAHAAETIALKSGETAEIGNLFWVANCRSLLKGPMTVEVLDGPADVTASIREQQIVPHIQNCAKPVVRRCPVAECAQGNQGAEASKAYIAGEISDSRWRTSEGS